MKKRTVRTDDVDLKDVSVGDEIILDDGQVATVKVIEAKPVEVKRVETVFYMEYEAVDKKNRRQLWCSVHGGDEQVERVHVGHKIKDVFSKLAGLFHKHED